MRALIIGASRGERVLVALRELGATPLALDITSAESASRLAWQLDGQAFDVIVHVAGVYGPRTTGLEAPTDAEFAQVMATNVLGPMRVLPALADLLAPGAKLAVLSSRMGAIGPRTGHQGWLYRASKTAVNSVLKDVSNVFAGRCTCVSVHPGWVRTDMGTDAADLSPEQSVADLRRLIAGLTSADNGRFLDHDGTPIDW